MTTAHRWRSGHLFALLVGVTGCGGRADPGTPIERPATPVVAAPVGGPIGTAHPLALIAVARNGRWLAACQARTDTDGEDGIAVSVGHHGDLEGDRMSPYLFRGAGDGMLVDRFVDASQDERWIAIVRDGKLVIVDDQRGVETVHDADTRQDRQLATPRVAAFSRDSKHVVFFQAGDTGKLVVRDLLQQRERVVAIDGLPWRVESVHGAWMRVLVIRKDTDGNGKVEWPSVDTNAPVGAACSGPAASFSTYGQRGDAPESIWLRADTGELKSDDALIFPLAQTVIARRADGAIVAGTTEIIGADCAAEVAGVVADPLRLVITCKSTTGSHAPLELVGAGGLRTKLGLEIQRGNESPRLLEDRVLCTSRTQCFRVSDGSQIQFDGDIVRPVDGRLLVKHDDAYSIVDIDSKQTRALRVDGNVTAAAGKFVAIDGTVVNLEGAGEVLYELPRPPLAVDLAGRALVGSADAKTGMLVGPLQWVKPAASPRAPMPDPEPPWKITGTVVDRNGAPVAGARITVSETAFVKNPDGSSRPTAPVVQPGVKAAGIGAWASFSQYDLGQKTRSDGTFEWRPVLSERHAIMVVTDDGRVGASPRLLPGSSSVRIVVERPAQLRVTCAGFTPMSADLGAGGVDIRVGALRFGAACGETIGGLPALRYTVATKADRAQYAGTTLDVAADKLATVTLAIAPPGTIRGKTVEYPGDRPIPGIECSAGWPDGDDDIYGDPGTTTDGTGTFTLSISRGVAVVRCESSDFAPGRTVVDLHSGSATATVRVVRRHRDRIDTGAEILAEPGGAFIVKSSKLAARAGLKRGDLVVAVDGISLAGLTRRAMSALAFELESGKSKVWTIERDGQRRTLEVK